MRARGYSRQVEPSSMAQDVDKTDIREIWRRWWEVKKVIDDKAKYTDWNLRDDIKAELHFDLIILLDEWGYPPIDRDEVYNDIFEQAENFKRHRL